MPRQVARKRRNAVVPRYTEIRRNLERAIVSGVWAPGHRIPSEQELLKRYQCSRMTVNKALSTLAELGLIVRRRRSGSFVAAPAAERSVLEIQNIEDEVRRSGRPYRIDMQSHGERKASAIDAQALSVAVGAPVLALACVHFAAERPLVFEQRLINLAAVPAARNVDFSRISPGTWLLAKVPWSEAEHHIRALNADREIAAALRIKTGQACLLIERHTKQAGDIVTHVVLIYPGDRHSLVARFNPAGRQ